MYFTVSFIQFCVMLKQLLKCHLAEFHEYVFYFYLFLLLLLFIFIIIIFLIFFAQELMAEWRLDLSIQIGNGLFFPSMQNKPAKNKTNRQMKGKEKGMQERR